MTRATPADTHPLAPADPARDGPSAWRHLPALLLFALLPIAVTWPLAAHLSTHIPGEVAGDNLSFLWSFWWMRQALASSTETFFRTTYLFHPFGVDLVQHTHSALHAWIGATLLASTSIIVAQNLVLLGVLALAGYGTYLLAWDLTRHRGAAIVAGLFFGAAPFVAGRLMGHYNLASAWGLPCFACACLRALRAPSAARATVAAGIAGVVMGGVAYTDYYYLFYLVLFVPLVLAVRWADVRVTRAGRPAWTWIDTSLAVLLGLVLAALIVVAVTGGFNTRIAGVRISMTSGLNMRTAAWILLLIGAWRRVRPRIAIARRATATGPAIVRHLGLIGVVAIVAGVIMAPLLAEAVAIWQRGDYRSLDIRWRNAPAGIDPLAILFGNPFHPILGRVSTALYDLFTIDRVEAVTWFGIAPMAVLIARRRAWLAAGSSSRREATLWLVVGAVFFVWALGPYLRVGGNSGLWLPASLTQYVPLLANVRLPSRALVMVYLSLAMLLALAIAARRPDNRVGTVTGNGDGMRPRAVWLVAAAILIDFAAIPIPLYETTPRPLTAYLASQPPGAVCLLPAGLRDGLGEIGYFEHRALFDQSIHGKPLVGGFVARLPSRVVRQYEEAHVLWSLIRLSSGETLSEDERARDRAIAGDFLRQSNIRYFVLDRERASPQLLQYVADVLPVTLQRREAHLELYVLN